MAYIDEKRSTCDGDEEELGHRRLHKNKTLLHSDAMARSPENGETVRSVTLQYDQETIDHLHRRSVHLYSVKRQNRHLPNWEVGPGTGFGSGKKQQEVSRSKCPPAATTVSSLNLRNYPFDTV